jgi:hypothetical protein
VRENLARYRGDTHVCVNGLRGFAEPDQQRVKGALAVAVRMFDGSLIKCWRGFVQRTY